MKTQDNKELQKQVKELNLQNEELLRQNDIITKQMNALKRMTQNNSTKSSTSTGSNASNVVDNETKAMIQELENVEMSNIERQMQPADLLLHRFAAMEANDMRLTTEQRMQKTAKMMGDLGEDIGELMGKWLPKNKVRGDRTQSKTLVFQVRQLIGHFNVLVGQMKATEEGFQNDLRLDIVRRDREIKSLKEQNRMVHELQDDLEERNDVIEQLKRHRDDLRVERDHLKAQTVEQQDMIFDVQNQVRYLNNELEKNRLTLVDLRSRTPRGSGLDLNAILADGDEEYSSGDDSDSPARHSAYSNVSSNQTHRSMQQQQRSGGSKRQMLSPSSVSLGTDSFKKMAAKTPKKRKGRQPTESEEIVWLDDGKCTLYSVITVMSC